ncbi:phosphatidylinositol N-acetylglucosaminyltransferase GPI15 SCDLUD_002750 [Saccharomycodes ludwigii]|uniref:phosphatidylinositol N-acetylglucosaminyltransferase GPI15 n=1 Tax=Saccharomycodes ludwigii TaxID=36035 RepID=UPI001E8782C0|nr:hypothetical protein SCDLUD_002750 [Saccharomycodes ludwigii]KAH3901261.1 hypothetical protein SCDLUD_002750 [Saccharomycodes ludwigii]
MYTNYVLDIKNFKGNVEISVVPKSKGIAKSFFYIIIFTILMGFISPSIFFNKLDVHYNNYIKLLIIIAIDLIIFKLNLNFGERLSIYPSHGILYEKYKIPYINTNSLFIAKQDIINIVINEVFVKSCRVVHMLVVIRKDRCNNTTTLFKNTMPRLKDLIEIYNICHTHFGRSSSHGA